MTLRRVLFLCTHNSARSQMAEGYLRAVAGDRLEPHSAGTEVTAVRPEAIAVMDEIGVDLRSQSSKHVERYLRDSFDWVITVCDQARETCPVLPGARATVHWSIDDPSGADGSPEERLAAFRRARDEIVARIRAFIDAEAPA